MVEKRVERLDKELSLTEEQKVEITKIYTEEMETMRKSKASRDENAGQMDDAEKKSRHEQMENQRKEINARIEALLTPEQAQKFAQMKEHKGRRGHHGRGPAGRPDGKGPKPMDQQGQCQCDKTDK